MHNGCTRQQHHCTHCFVNNDSEIGLLLFEKPNAKPVRLSAGAQQARDESTVQDMQCVAAPCIATRVAKYVVNQHDKAL